MKKKVYNERILRLVKQASLDILKKRNVSLRKAAILLDVHPVTFFDLLTNEKRYPCVDILYEIAKKFDPEHPVIGFIDKLENKHGKNLKQE